MILLLAGTSEGRREAALLEQAGVACIASTATLHGKDLLAKDFRGEILAGPLEYKGLLELIATRRIAKIIDATHPFAEEISRLAQKACRENEISYERIEREALSFTDQDGVFKVSTAEEAARLAASFSGQIFLTVGSNKLEHFTTLLDPGRLIVRILPLMKSLQKCLDLGIKPENIIAMQGPFDEETNILLFKRYEAKLVVTKESGISGGTAEKLSAAASLNLPVILLLRPGR